LKVNLHNPKDQTKNSRRIKMSITAEVIPSVSEVNKSDMILSDKKVKSWNWTDKEGKTHAGSQDYAELYYKESGKKMAIALTDVRTINGIQTTNDGKRGFMSINLTDEQSSDIQKKVDDSIFNLVFDQRKDLLKQGNKISHPSEIRLMFKGFIKEGDEKKDGGRWNDQITVSVPMKKKSNQLVVDDNICSVEDLEGNPYNWMGLDRQKLKDVVIEVEKIVLGKDISLRGVLRMVVPDAKARPRVTTKRKLEQSDKDVSDTRETEDDSNDTLKKVRTE
jgi:hypothetical protein